MELAAAFARERDNELSYLSDSFCRSLRPVARRRLIAEPVQAITLSDAQQRPSRQQAQPSRSVERPKQPILDQTERGEDASAVDEQRECWLGLAAPFVTRSDTGFLTRANPLDPGLPQV